jgi:Rieske Fe-S protein
VFLRTTACGLTVAGVGVGGGGCSNGVQPAPLADLAVVDDPTDSLYGQIPIAPALYPDLAPVGGALTLRVTPPAGADHPFQVPSDGILLVHRAEASDPPEYVALNSACPHAGCPLGYSHGDQQIKCPCHGSRFRVIADPNDSKSCAGQVVHRPARANLRTWPVNVDANGMIYINLNSSDSCEPLLPPVVDGKVVLPLSQYSDLAASGGSLVGRPKGYADTLLVIRVDSSTVKVVSDICTHLGCGVAFSKENQEIECPCHGSKFNLEGAVTNGPAPRPLKQYQATVDDVAVTINIS